MNEAVTIEDIKITVRNVLSELIAEETLSGISDTESISEELGIGSMAIVQIFVTCQEKYGADLTNEMQLGETMSIQKLAEIIYKKVKN